MTTGNAVLVWWQARPLFPNQHTGTDLHTQTQYGRFYIDPFVITSPTPTPSSHFTALLSESGGLPFAFEKRQISMKRMMMRWSDIFVMYIFIRFLWTFDFILYLLASQFLIILVRLTEHTNSHLVLKHVQTQHQARKSQSFVYQLKHPARLACWHLSSSYKPKAHFGSTITYMYVALCRRLSATPS